MYRQPVQNSRIEGTDHIISDGSNTMMKPIKIGGRPDFDNVKNTEKKEASKEMFPLQTRSKTPSNQHSNHFINHNPLRIMKMKLLLDALSSNNSGYVEDNY